MKKMIRNIFGVLFILVSSVMMSSCIIMLDELNDYFTERYGSVVFENRDSNRKAYIKEIKYCEENCNYWRSCWTCPEDKDDSEISFYLTPGNYRFQVEVIYPKYRYNKDYYNIFYTEDWSDVTVNADSTSTVVFDGERLYER